MTQLDLIDRREITTVTQAMQDDPFLRSAIRFVRKDAIGSGFRWPFVEALVEIEGRQAWAVDDDGKRYVVLGKTVFPIKNLRMASPEIRKAAAACFWRLDDGRQRGAMMYQGAVVENYHSLNPRLSLRLLLIV